MKIHSGYIFLWAATVLIATAAWVADGGSFGGFLFVLGLGLLVTAIFKAVPEDF